MSDERIQERDEVRKPALFSTGYRACDALLLALLFGGPAATYLSVNQYHVQFGWFHIAILGISCTALSGLLRFRIAFALLALPFFVWASYSLIRAAFFPPEWSDLVSPIYAGKWGVSIVIEYLIGGYFWRKFTGVEFFDWIGEIIYQFKG